MISVIVEGDQKIFLFYDNAQYGFRYVGNGAGNLDVTIQEFDQAGGARTHSRLYRFAAVRRTGLHLEGNQERGGQRSLIRWCRGKRAVTRIRPYLLLWTPRPMQVSGGYRAGQLLDRQ